MKKHWPYHAFVILAAAGALGYIFFNLEVSGPSRHVQVMDGLQKLKKYDSAVNKDVLNVRSGLLRHYDPLVKTSQGMTSIIVGLEDRNTGIVGRGNADIDQMVKQFAGLHVKRASLVERFKAKNSTLKNSLFYFPTAATLFVRQAQEKSAPGELVSGVERLLQNLLSFYVNSNPAMQQKVRANLHEVSRLAGDAPDELQAELQGLLKHAGIVLWHKKEVDGLLRQITSAETEAVADSLFHVYQVQHEEELQAAKNLRAVFHIGTSCLFCYILFLIIGMFRVRRERNEAGPGVERQRAVFASS